MASSEKLRELIFHEIMLKTRSCRTNYNLDVLKEAGLLNLQHVAITLEGGLLNVPRGLTTDQLKWCSSYYEDPGNKDTQTSLSQLQ